MCKLSIVMPVFNHHEEVKLMVDSILDNTFQQWELIIVDDGSDEKTLSLLMHYSDADKRIIILRRDADELKGAQTCRNKGLEYAKGEYVTFFDSDDLLTPFCLQQRVEAMDNNKDADFLVFPSGLLEGGQMEADKTDMKVFGYQVFDDDIKMFASRILPFIVWNNIYRRKSLIKLNVKWDVSLKSLQDSDFNLCCLLKGMKYKYVYAQPDYAYRVITAYTSITSAIVSNDHKNSHIYAINKFYEIVRQQFHHKYDKDLYFGTLYIYNSVTGVRPDDDFARRVVDCLKKWDPNRSNKLKRAVRFCAFLKCFMPVRYARRLAFLSYLLKFRRIKNKKIAKIKKIKQELR